MRTVLFFCVGALRGGSKHFLTEQDRHVEFFVDTVLSRVFQFLYDRVLIPAHSQEVR